jgi:hypothetical protein
MLAILKGIAVVLVTIFLFAFSQGVKAQVPHTELYKGKCAVKGGEIDPAEDGVFCKVIMDVNGRMYALIYADPPENPVEVYQFDAETKTFRSVWKVAKGGKET